MTEPTERTEEDQKKVGRWAEKVYSKQLVEYANQNLREDEKNIYQVIFNELVETHKFERVEELMLLDTMVYDFIRIKRIQGLLMKEGDVTKIILRSGQIITKAHEASYLLNAVETQFRNTMRELMMTPKEIVKKKIGLGTKDFASFLSEAKVIDAKYDEVKEK